MTKVKHILYSTSEIEEFSNYIFTEDNRIKNIITGNIIETRPNAKGYSTVNLMLNGKLKVRRFARLVLSSFASDSHQHRFEASHIDETRDNDLLDNLVWESIRENRNRPLRKDRTSKIVFQYSLQGELIKEYSSITSVKESGFLDSSVCSCCKDNSTSHRGFLWSYNSISGEELNRKIAKALAVRRKPVLKMTRDLLPLQLFSSVSEAAESVGLKSNSLSRCFKDESMLAGGFKWRLA